MVAGKLSILLISTSAFSSNIHDPKFFEYRADGFVNMLAEMTYGWTRKLDAAQKEAYQSALTHAVMFSDNGQKVTWYKNDASGIAVPVMTWPTGSGYCRRIHIQSIAHGVEKAMAATACYSNTNSNWQWIRE